ncbi:uncharacterized protein LOC131658025 [Vicia villosa]|uniref:uncharacterized protein LOC131658025 n=1 Tax=Vicia villosa TaxID=3911 RepID=UPI00273BB225|nr:uncharacterized protein LOC131658025 [Vicia villosa]
MRGWEEGRWKWGDLGVNEGLTGDEGTESMLGVLKGRLEEFGGLKEGRDSVVWSGKADPVSSFSVALCYDFFLRDRTPHGSQVKYHEAFEFLWKSEVPFKVKAFGWRLFRYRLPIIDLLLRRGMAIPADSLNCILCGNCEENLKHFFFSCGVAKRVWSEVAVWVGKEEKFEEACKANFLDWFHFFRAKKVKQGKEGMIWLACVWTFWTLRNGVRFRKDKWSVNDIVWSIKLLAWKWMFCGNITHPNFSFYEFVMDPVFFLT